MRRTRSSRYRCLQRRRPAGHSSHGLFVPNHKKMALVDQNIGCASGELAPYFRRLKLRDRAFHKRADAIEPVCIESRPIFDQTASGEMGKFGSSSRPKAPGIVVKLAPIGHQRRHIKGNVKILAI